MNRANYPVLPVNWRSIPLKHAVQINPEVLPDNTPPDTTLAYVDIAALENGVAELSPTEVTFELAPSRARRVLRSGDTIVSTVRTYLKAVAMFPDVKTNLIASTGFAVLRPKGSMSPRFAYWATLAEPFIESVVAHSDGVSYPAINPTLLGTLPMAVPPLNEQVRITNFLDDKTARIDALIAEKERLMAVLAESLEGCIERAVQPDNAASMMPLKRAVSRVSTGPFGSALHSSEYVTEGIPVINPSHIVNGVLTPDESVSVDADTAERLSSYRLRQGQLVVGRRGEMGRCGIVPEEGNGWICGTGCLVVVPNHKLVDASYLQLVVSSRASRDWLSLESVGSTMENLNEEILGRLPGFFPDLYEQRRRVSCAQSAKRSHGALLLHVTEHLARLREYRSSLISATVTGQLDVSAFKKAIQ